jgi:hypothetical protein
VTRVASISVPGASIPAGASYAFLGGSGVTEQGRTASVIEAALVESIHAEMQTRGFQLSASRDADILFGFIASPTEDLDPDETMRRFGVYLGKDGWNSPAPTGSLLVLLVGRQTQSALWRASIQADVREDLGDRERAERISGFIARLFRTFPPTGE